MGFGPGEGPAPILDFPVLESTNAEARRRAEAGEAGPFWFTAAVQTQGRGRRGREWSTGAGNLAATLLAVTDKPPAEAAGLSFVAALAVADLADAYVPASLVKFKWPNDVMLAGAKAAGILIESGGRADGQLWVAIGIGVNLNHAPTDVERPAAALAQHLKSSVVTAPDRAVCMEQLRDAMARWINVWLVEGFAPIRAGWTARAAGLGGPCEARLGHETVAGIAEGLDSDGALVLRLGDGSARRITAGDVFFGGA